MYGSNVWEYIIKEPEDVVVQLYGSLHEYINAVKLMMKNLYLQIDYIYVDISFEIHVVMFAW